MAYRLEVCLAIGACSLVCLLGVPSTQAAAKQTVVKHVRVNGVRLGYRTVGTGSPLVMIPGFAFTMAEWDPKLIGVLSSHHRVLLFDNRGVATSTDTAGNILTIAEMSSDTAGLIRALRLGRCDVFGWSMGGYIAQDLVIRHPAQVRRLVLASTDPGGNKAIQPPAKVVNELQHATLSTLLKLLFPSSAISAGQAWEQRIGVQAGRLHFTANDFFVSTRIVKQQFRAAGPGWESRGHGNARLGDLRLPTLIAAGAEDVIVPAPNASLLHRRIRNSKVVIYAHAGHAFLFQDPLAVGRLINGFLR